MNNKLRTAVLLAEMKKHLIWMKHLNLCAEREQSLGGWQRNWTEALREVGDSYEATKKELEALNIPPAK